MSLTLDEFIPNEPGTGKIGTETDPWAEGHFSSLTMGGGAVAPLASPLFTGNPRGPTPAAGNNSTALATTAYVDAADALKAPLASPTFTGSPAAPTASPGTNTTQLATTAFVQTAAGSVAHTQNTDTKLANGTANETTASELRTHLDDATKHRQINDSGNSSTTLWSAEKIATAIAAALGDVPTEFTLANITDAGDLAGLDEIDTGNIANQSVTTIKVEGGVATPNNRTFWGKAANGTVGFHDLTSQVALRSVPTGANGTLTLQNGEMVVSLGTSGTTAAAGNDSRFPTAGEKAALAGSSGTPGANNTYVTEQGLAAHAVDITTDTAPELGGNLSTAGFTIQFENSGAISDTSGNELLQFGKTASAVNHVKVTNAATGSAATVSAVGDDTNIALNLIGKGTGGVTVAGASVLANNTGLSGGQTLVGGTAASETVTLESTSHATKGGISVAAGNWLQLPEISAPATPASGFGRLYPKTDGKVYFLNDSGTEYDLTTATPNEWKEHFIQASSMVPRSSSGAALSKSDGASAAYATREYLLFDGTSVEYAYAYWRLPDNWAGGNVKAKIHWFPASGTSADVVWGVAGCALLDGAESLTVGSEVSVTDTGNAATDTFLTTAATGAITIANATAGDIVIFRIKRDATNVADTLNGIDACLFGISIQFQTSGTTAAW